jgi:poly-gamma-glutamate capsule biosynthesis protein CapA/YwtB (metallophosphatase superfamily)
VLRAPTRICAGGDVTLGTNLDTLWAKTAAKVLRAEFRRSSAPDSLLTPLVPLFTDADVVLVNVEGAIGDGPATAKCGKRAKHCFAFRQPPDAAAALRHLADSAVVVGNVANNHARDAGDDGFIRSVGALTRAGVAVTGADTLATPIVTRHGDTIGVIGFYTSSDSPDARDLAAVRRHVTRAVAQYGTVIVTMHLGAEGVDAQRTRDSTELFLGTIDRGNPVAFANAALDAGATMVIGHGPHVLRAAEWRGDRLVIYSLGNLLTYGPFRLGEPLNRGAVACADIDSARHVRTAWLRPTVQLAPGILRPDSTNRAAALIDSLSALDFPATGVTVGLDGVLRRRQAGETAVQRSGAGRLPTAAGGTSAIQGTRATPRQSLIFGAGARLSGLSITRPATLLAWTKRPPPT